MANKTQKRSKNKARTQVPRSIRPNASSIVQANFLVEDAYTISGGNSNMYVDYILLGTGKILKDNRLYNSLVTNYQFYRFDSVDVTYHNLVDGITFAVSPNTYVVPTKAFFKMGLDYADVNTQDGIALHSENVISAMSCTELKCLQTQKDMATMRYDISDKWRMVDDKSWSYDNPPYRLRYGTLMSRSLPADANPYKVARVVLCIKMSFKDTVLRNA